VNVAPDTTWLLFYLLLSFPFFLLLLPRRVGVGSIRVLLSSGHCNGGLVLDTYDGGVAIAKGMARGVRIMGWVEGRRDERALSSHGDGGSGVNSLN
jgi:hypothetical protein